ncbi:hypothetical protein ACHQM5_026840 [Ranunculus cassubicifolius]
MENEGFDTRQVGETSLTTAPSNDERQLLDPQLVKHKGRSKRYKSHLDDGPKNKNQRRNSDTTQKKGNNPTRSKATRGRARNKQDVNRDVEIASSQQGRTIDNVQFPPYGVNLPRAIHQEYTAANNAHVPQYGATSTHASDQLVQGSVEPDVVGHHRPRGKTRFDLNKIFEVIKLYFSENLLSYLH